MNKPIEGNTPANNKTNEKQQSDENKDYSYTFNETLSEDDENDFDFEIYSLPSNEDDNSDHMSFLDDDKKYSDDQMFFFNNDEQNNVSFCQSNAPSENSFLILCIDEFEKNLNKIVNGGSKIKIPKKKLGLIYEKIRQKHASNLFSHRKWYRITKSDERKRESMLKKMMMNADIILYELQLYFWNKA